jgi:hypothetical protein
MPIKDNLYIHIPIRNNQNNTVIWDMAEVKYTNYKMKSINGRIEIMLPYFTAWNVDAIKYYINLINGVNDKDAVIRINNFHCDFEETIEFLNGIFEIRGNIKNQLTKPYIKSLAIPLNELNIQMIILTYGGRMSPKHCWKNFTIEQALTIWRKTDDRIPKEADTWWGNKKLSPGEILIANLPWNTRINLMIKGEGGDPDTETMIIAWNSFSKLIQRLIYFDKCDKWNRSKTMDNGREMAFIDLKQTWDWLRDVKEFLIVDGKKFEIVTKECFDIMKLIEKKINYVNNTKYKDDKEEWEFYQFGKNEYQAELFFVRNTDRIKIMLNIIKKQEPKYKERRCKLACDTARIRGTMTHWDEDCLELLPILYEKKKDGKRRKDI